MPELSFWEQFNNAVKGDKDCFDVLFRPFQNEILVHCYRMMASLEDAEDQRQETFFRAWK